MMKKRIPVVLFWLAAVVTVYATAPLNGDKPVEGKAKQEGNLPLPVRTEQPKNELELTDRQPFNGSRISAAGKGQVLLGSPAPAFWFTTPPACTIENPEGNGSFQVLSANDDGSTGKIALPFSFNLYGNSYDTVYVNNNGNITFGSANGVFVTEGFPFATPMVAPFWADVDTRYTGSGLVYYKVEATRFTVIWNHVGYFNNQASGDKFNTFKLVITNGADQLIGVGNNVAFYYGDMQWTTGTASGGSGGFGGSAATVGANKGTGNNACFFYQLGRFSQAGTDSTNLQTAGGVDYLDNRCFFFDASTVQGLALNFTYQKSICATSFTPAITNPQNCRVNSYQWNFGDGGTTSEANPVHAYSHPGTYSVSVTIHYTCGACSEATLSRQKSIQVLEKADLLTDSLITVLTDSREQVLQTSAATFSDAWPLAYEKDSLNQLNSYLNGTLGVWRNEGSYVYEVPRKASAPVKLASDGTFPVDQFNWAQADLQAIPHWTKAETKTIYSSFSYELENRDVLGVYSAALYDYGGHLPSANGVNTRYAEMAFTSFEYLVGKVTGNWIFGNQPLPLYTTYPVQIGLKNTAVVRASLAELEGVTKVDVQAKVFGLLARTANYQQTVDVLCKQAYPEHPEWSIVVLKRTPFTGLWSGSLRVQNQVTPVINPTLDTTWAHAGKSSLKVTTEKTFSQALLQLDSAKSYFLSTWVSVNNPSVLTPKLADNLGVILSFKDKQGTLLTTTTLEPSGPVIEGWQQVRGVFVCPDEEAQLSLTFKPGSTGTAWYDDLRMHPEKGNMKSYVYDLKDYRLRAILDEENFASFFYYDVEGNLYLTKQETEEGLKTLSENVSYIKENKP